MQERMLARQTARELSVAEIQQISGAGSSVTSYSNNNGVITRDDSNSGGGSVSSSQNNVCVNGVCRTYKD
jgi:hypothetical protein